MLSYLFDFWSCLLSILYRSFYNSGQKDHIFLKRRRSKLVELFVEVMPAIRDFNCLEINTQNVSFVKSCCCLPDRQKTGFARSPTQPMTEPDGDCAVWAILD